MTTTPAASSVGDVLRRHLEAVGDDLDAEHEMYAEDAVLEFPQSGERFDRAGQLPRLARSVPRRRRPAGAADPRRR